MAEMATTYDPKQVESKWYRFWEGKGYFGADVKDPRSDYFVIAIPPPNVTGSLHMGHALNHTIHDLLIRWNRMRGKLTLCVPGTDHAGIATQIKVEQKLREEEGLTRHDLGREEFLKRVWAWREEYGGVILKQFRALGCSYDWSRERFTMDEGYEAAVLTAFVEFYKRGWIYRGSRVINWCPRCFTALSDLEVEHAERHTHLWHIRYPGEAGGEGITVATTRPETMLGDTAVAVHPDDPRYQSLLGKSVILPLMDRVLPVLSDEAVDPQFGTGAVKVTPAHDSNDYDIAQRHNLPMVVVIGEDGSMTSEAGKYAGLDRYDCREAVVQDLEAQRLLARTEDYSHSVGQCARCGIIIEPLLSEQWFVSMKPMAEKALEALGSRVRYIPERFGGISAEWVENIRDWCISRQLWWGHRLPVWHCEDCGEITVEMPPLAACGHCRSSNVHRNEDVLDTWFSSALWPHSVLGWPEETPELKRFYPTSLLITARDILHLWVSRMIMTGLEFLGDIPFRDVYVHPTILNWEGKRMSKSLGTGVDPLDLIDQYGTDATRFGLAYMCSITQDVRFTEERIEMSRNFCNKVWNVSRFVLMNLQDFSPDPVLPPEEALTLEDRWILSRYAETRNSVTIALEQYNFDVASRALYDFVWGEFCDWYVEMAKQRLYESAGAPPRRTAQQVLWFVLRKTLHLLHPFAPFITEDVYQRLPALDADPESLMISPWPEDLSERINTEVDIEFAALTDVIRSIRNLRAELSLPPSTKAPAVVVCADTRLREFMETNAHHVRALASVSDLLISESEADKPAKAISAVLPAAHLYVPVAGLLDIEREAGRLSKELGALTTEIERSEKKLADPNFTERARPEVVEKERRKLEEFTAKRDRLARRLEDLRGV